MSASLERGDPFRYSEEMRDGQDPNELTVVEASVEALRTSEENPRRIAPERLEQLKRSLAADPAMLQARPLIALPNGTVVAGNMRLLAARELGWQSIPVVYADLDPERARLWMLRDNQGYGEWDDDALASLLSELSSGGVDLDSTGFAEDDVRRILDGIVDEPAVDADAVPPAPEEPESKPGEMYELGPHRLLCGDATQAEAVSELMQGEQAALMATDPPYGVSLDHTWRDGLRQPIGAARTGRVENDHRADWRQAWALTDAPVAYVWHSALHASEVWQSLEATGFEIRQQIIWVKDVHVLGRAAYQWKHEPCWYAVRKGKGAHWQGGRKQSTVWQAASPIMAFGGGGDDASTPHPTQKPVSLFETPIRNHTRRGEVVYEPFAGSGTQFIAAERLGRRCFGIELDPRYCDVIRERYQRFTGG